MPMTTTMRTDSGPRGGCLPGPGPNGQVHEPADRGAGQQEKAGLGGDEEALVLHVLKAAAEQVEA